MKKLILMLFFVSAVVVAHEDDGREPGQTAATLSAEQQAVVASLLAYAAAYQAADLVAIKAAVTPDGRFSYLEGTALDPDWDTYAGHLAKELPAFSETQYELTDIRPEVRGDMAFATFDWALDVVIVSEQFPGGKHPVSMRGAATAVLVKVDGDWKLRHLHSATAPPPKPDAGS